MYKHNCTEFIKESKARLFYSKVLVFLFCFVLTPLYSCFHEGSDVRRPHPLSPSPTPLLHNFYRFFLQKHVSVMCLRYMG